MSNLERGFFSGIYTGFGALGFLLAALDVVPILAAFMSAALLATALYHWTEGSKS